MDRVMESGWGLAIWQGQCPYRSQWLWYSLYCSREARIAEMPATIVVARCWQGSERFEGKLAWAYKTMWMCSGWQFWREGPLKASGSHKVSSLQTLIHMAWLCLVLMVTISSWFFTLWVAKYVTCLEFYRSQSWQSTYFEVTTNIFFSFLND